MKLKIEYLIIIGLFFYIAFIQTCNTKPESTIKTVEIIRTDSLRVYDTIKTVLRVPITSIQLIDTIYINDSLKSFKYAKKDSLIDYEITVESECKPKDVKIKYDLTQLTILDSVFIRDSVHTKEIIKKSFMSFGGQVIGGSDNFGFAPKLYYHHKSGSNFGFGYDLINGNIHLTYTRRIKLRN